jgi:hypothetical protein
LGHNEVAKHPNLPTALVVQVGRNSYAPPVSGAELGSARVGATLGRPVNAAELVFFFFSVVFLFFWFPSFTFFILFFRFFFHSFLYFSFLQF